MSGGSYGYLHAWDADAHIALRDMADRLDEIAPGSRAARRTRQLIETLDDGELREVWRCVEWFDSHDYSREQALQAVAEYEPQIK